jgi:hypothetical protein
VNEASLVKWLSGVIRIDGVRGVDGLNGVNEMSRVNGVRMATLRS